MEKWLRRLAWLMTIVFMVIVVLPLIAERLSVNLPHKSMFCSFQLKDESGRMHNGHLAHGKWSGFDAESLLYGYEPPKDKDLNAWRKTVPDKVRYEDTQEGFYWSDKGLLWAQAGMKGIKEKIFHEGRNLGLDNPLSDQTEMVLPGAPWDTQTPHMTVLGRFPDYQLTYNDDYFTFDLLYRARTPGWYMYNEGIPFKAGDFGYGSMNELACSLSGTIVHKKSGERFNVTGTGLFEDALGVPWNMFEWGGHDWRDIHFSNGWSGSIWRAHDDWQWGYNTYPHLGWIYDPETDTFHTFYRVDMPEQELVADELNEGFDNVLRVKWRAIANGGTLELEETNISYVPVLTTLSFLPMKPRLSYGTSAFEGRFIRRDGTVVELKNGMGTREHFNRFFPDFRCTAPILLILLILSWGAASVSKRRTENRPYRYAVFVTVLFILGVFWLYLAWSF